METTLKMSSSMTMITFMPLPSSALTKPHLHTINSISSPIGRVSFCASKGAESRPVSDAHRQRSGIESLFCYDKTVPEEIIAKPIGLSMAEKEIGDKQRCTYCQAKGAVLCATCVGSGLYVDSIMESQGIIVKVRCLGCGGTGNIMCAECGGRGHLAPH